MNLKKKRVTVIGLGKSGEAAAALLSSQGAKVTVVDDHPSDPPFALTSLKSNFPILFHLGSWVADDLLSQDLIVISPGVPLSRLPESELLRAGIPIIGEMELAFQFITAPVIAITGTNGKSTTTTLVAEILKESGLNIFCGGNIGVPLSLAALQSFDYVVVEVSSFQLETIVTFRPKIAALLNVTEDHLNRHGSLEKYREIKERIFSNQTEDDYAVFNDNDPPSQLSTLKGSLIGFENRDKNVPPTKQHPSTQGVALSGDTIVSNVIGSVHPIIALNAIKLFGSHNVENVMAAIAMSQLAGATHAAIEKTLTRFSGLPHRMEKVREIAGVTYINDSKGTNVGAALKSLEGMRQPVILIAGGLDKGADFAPLRKMIFTKVKRLILMGDAVPKMARCFHDYPAMIKVDSMQEAVLAAAAESRPGDVVLLSPSCASFDMFKNFQHRGDCFKQAVLELESR